MEFKKCGNANCDCGIVYLPLRSVDGIECDGRLVKNENKISLILESKKWCVMNDVMDLTSHTYFQSSVTVESLSEVLSSLKFNKLTNKFQTTAPFDWSFLESESVKLFEPCCVCYERTESKTTCNHPICIPCYDKIKCTDMETNETKCPICREDCSIE